MNTEQGECIHSGTLQCNVPVGSTGKKIDALVRVFHSGLLKINCTHLDAGKCDFTDKDCSLKREETDGSVETSPIDIGETLRVLIKNLISSDSVPSDLTSEVRKCLFQEALRVCGGSIEKASKLLDISKSTLSRETEKFRSETGKS